MGHAWQDACFTDGRQRGYADDMGKAKAKKAACADCYFRCNDLCALDLPGPCSTFRPVERNLEPERQLAFVFRTPRTRAAYAFPQPR